MPAVIHVVLQQDVPKLGKSGELVRVRPGFARNYLIPRHFALAATEKNVAQIEHAKQRAAARAAKERAEATGVAGKLSAIAITIARKVGEGERLFGSVTAKDVALALAAQGLTVDRKKIDLAEPNKALGMHQVSVKLLGDVVAVIKVEVVAQT